MYSQYVGDDADAPQIGRRRHGLLGRHLRRAELGCAVLGLDGAARVVAPRAAEVDQLDLVRAGLRQEQILRLQGKKVSSGTGKFLKM